MRNTLLATALCFAAALPAAAQSDQPAAPATAKPAAGSLFSDLWHDLPRLVSKPNLFTLGAGGALALAVHPAESDLGSRAAKSEELDEILDGGSFSGSGWVQIGSALGTYALGRATRNDRLFAVGTDLVQAQILNSVMTQSVKFAAQRTRPDGGRFSFPSGHTSGTFATATVLAKHFGWKAGVPAYAAATYVAASRIQENRHYVSDVVFGAALGIVAGRTVSVGGATHRFALTPALVPGGGGVFVTRVK